jgi:hypothetical protein
VRLDDCTIPDLPIGGGRSLATIQRADLFGEQREVGIARLIAAVLRTLNTNSGAPAEDKPPGTYAAPGGV